MKRFKTVQKSNHSETLSISSLNMFLFVRFHMVWKEEFIQFTTMVMVKMCLLFDRGLLEIYISNIFHFKSPQKDLLAHIVQL